jgi:hypothetical protein
MVVVGSLGLATVPVPDASAAASAEIIGRLADVARTAGFSIPENSFSAVVRVAQSVPATAPPSAPPTERRTPREHDDFQSMLFHLALEPADQAYCDGKLGAANQKNEAEHRSCRITRNFLWYIQAEPEGVDGLFPPLADIRYCRTAAERKELFFRLEDAMK